MKSFVTLRTALQAGLAYRRTVAELRRLPLELRLDLDIYAGDIPAIARRAVYGA